MPIVPTPFGNCHCTMRSASTDVMDFDFRTRAAKSGALDVATPTPAPSWPNTTVPLAASTAAACAAPQPDAVNT